MQKVAQVKAPELENVLPVQGHLLPVVTRSIQVSTSWHALGLQTKFTAFENSAALNLIACAKYVLNYMLFFLGIPESCQRH